MSDLGKKLAMIWFTFFKLTTPEEWQEDEYFMKRKNKITGFVEEGHTLEEDDLDYLAEELAKLAGRLVYMKELEESGDDIEAARPLIVKSVDDIVSLITPLESSD
jgi:hypothetical protein